MFKALLKKQLMEVNTWLIQNKKNGKRRSAFGIVLLILMYVLLFGIMGMLFYFAAAMLCGPLVLSGYGWLYFAVMGLMAILLGVFGSVFNTYATLYKAKDNEFLLAMPIPPSRILAVRLLGVWMWSFIYEAIVFIPALIVYWNTAVLNGSLTLMVILSGILLLLLISIFNLALACTLGWVVAKISGRLKSKSIVTVAASLAFMGLYYYVYFRAYEMLQSIIANAETVGMKIKGAAYPLYLMGRAGEGRPVPMIIITILVIAVFAAICFCMSRSFLKMATAAHGVSKTKYKERTTKKHSINGALLRKEAKRFTGSPTYMLNCGLGTIILLITAAAVVIKSAWIQEVMAQSAAFSSFVPIIVCAGICTLAAMNDITAPSVSLEGRNLWILKTLPVSAWQVLKAKLKLHLFITEIPVFICSLCMAVVLKPGFTASFFILILPAMFVLFTASFGLAVNLKLPNLKWTDETVPVKQSMGVMIVMFGGWVFVIALGGLYFILGTIVSTEAFLMLCTVLIAGLSFGLLIWLKKKGAEIFETL